MRPTLTFEVRPDLPEPLAALSQLVNNIWFSWQPAAIELFQRIDRQLWAQVNFNPVAMLNQVSQERLETLAQDSGFLAHLERVASNFNLYQAATTCPFLGKRAPQDFQVAYFSAEYGLAQCLPLYSGGLGILSGDHLKSASDLNVPLVGIGLAYRQGYFTQYLDSEGWQQEEYFANDFWNLPMELVKNQDGGELTVQVDIEGQPLNARVWLIRVGRISLYLMDANIDANPPELRAITHQLYGGDNLMRIRQEILLGIGGVRLLDALGLHPRVIHMNEGHSAFASLERIRMLRQEKGLSFDEARVVVQASNCFTTHTPVPAGNDYFDPELVRRHFNGYVAGLGISMPVLLGYGRVNPMDQQEQFCMTVLALRISGFNNGVSRLHGEVSRKMWQGVWPNFPLEDLPLTHITNGVHIPSWISNDTAYLYQRYLGPGWSEDPDSLAVWKDIEQVPDAELWRVHERRRSQMVAFVRRTLTDQLKRRGASAEQIKRAGEVLNPEALTIVFARRFATYKRAVLLAQDLERLAAMVGDRSRPMQFIFAGKAHPKDNEGKEFIRRIVSICQDPRFREHLVFIEDYDIEVANQLVQGADIWLNTPRRPLEACGTSGMKAVANGGLHLSILDGWWDEGFAPGLGWALGRGEEYTDEAYQDQVEGRALYRILENEVRRLFYERDEGGLPRGWLSYMKKSLAALCPEFNGHRMVEQYIDKAYLPAAKRYDAMVAEDYAGARELGSWVRHIMEHWSQVKVLEVNSPAADQLTYGDEISVSAKVQLGGLPPQDVAVDAYYGRIDAEGNYSQRQTHQLQPEENDQDGAYWFHGTFKADSTGRLGLAVRVVPYHPRLESRYAVGLAVWG